ncbi:MAG TPA: cytochrome C [Roseovarius nubinhibens]|uniref:Cytochrome C n=2 Tax=Roseovarius nubinhibens TaxID=314263 RepID=A0A348W8Z1_9RHOB|nr:cytochrome C [Roseovarius nubinhibens]|tara:strand:- start:617 stop:1342 length:726 start_codon:yes stop_codon:yes gene_type:complete
MTMMFSMSRPAVAALVLLMPALPAQAGLDELLASADVAEGEKIFRKCKACHTVEKDGKSRSGPNLYDIVGGPVAAREGFKYSGALSEYGGEWSPERLDAFLEKPKDEVKGTRMSFPGLKKPEDRAALIAYLASHSDEPMRFGAAAAAQEASAETGAEAGSEEFGLLVAGPGAEETFYACTACHSEMIVAQQGLTRKGWEEMLDWMVEEQGMSALEEPDLSAVLDYLAANYGEDRPNFPTPE